MIEFDALGTRWWIEAGGADALELEKLVKDFGQKYSRFDPDSMLSLLNKTGILENAPKELLQMLELGLSFYKDTLGKFDISKGVELAKKGYGKLQNTKSVSGNLDQRLVISGNKITLDGIEIDLGGIGKGFVVDRLANFLNKSGQNSFVINAGGDIFCKGEPVAFFLEHPYHDDEAIGKINLKNQSLCASSILKRTWRGKNDKIEQHIIDANQEFVASFVVAKDTTTADILATILLIVDKHTVANLKKKYDFEFLILRKDLSYLKSSGFDGELFE